jgi:hypothetical protein
MSNIFSLFFSYSLVDMTGSKLSTLNYSTNNTIRNFTTQKEEDGLMT